MVRTERKASEMSSLKEDFLSEINDDYRYDLFQEIVTAREDSLRNLEKKFKIAPKECYVVKLSDGFYVLEKSDVLKILKHWNSANATHCGENVRETYPIPFKGIIE